MGTRGAEGCRPVSSRRPPPPRPVRRQAPMRHLCKALSLRRREGLEHRRGRRRPSMRQYRCATRFEVLAHRHKSFVTNAPLDAPRVRTRLSALEKWRIGDLSMRHETQTSAGGFGASERNVYSQWFTSIGPDLRLRLVLIGQSAFMALLRRVAHREDRPRRGGRFALAVPTSDRRPRPVS